MKADIIFRIYAGLYIMSAMAMLVSGWLNGGSKMLTSLFIFSRHYFKIFWAAFILQIGLQSACLGS